MRYFVTIDGQEQPVEVRTLPGGRLEVRLAAVDGGSAPSQVLPAEISAVAGRFTVTLAGRVFDLSLDGELPDVEVWASGRRAAAKVESERMRAAASVRGGASETNNGLVTSPMPGKVVKVLVAEGDEVTAGLPLVVVEAMKMENELVAPRAGVVKKIHVRSGDAVEGGAQLVTVS